MSILRNYKRAFLITGNVFFFIMIISVSTVFGETLEFTKVDDAKLYYQQYYLQGKGYTVEFDYIVKSKGNYKSIEMRADRMFDYFLYDFSYKAEKKDDNTKKWMGDYLRQCVIGDGNVTVNSPKRQEDGTYKIHYKVTNKYVVGKATQQRFYNRCNSLLKEWKLEGKSDKQKAKIIYKWMYKNVSYDKKYKIYTPQTALFKKKSVCQGYAYLYDYLCRQAGIKSKVVSSKTHSWNLTKIGKRWYNNDVTWASCAKKQYKKYWMKNYKFTKLKDHKPEKKYGTKKFKKKYPIGKKNLSW